MEDFNFQMNKEGKSNDKIDSKGPRKMALKKEKKKEREERNKDSSEMDHKTCIIW